MNWLVESGWLPACLISAGRKVDLELPMSIAVSTAINMKGGEVTGMPVSTEHCASRLLGGFVSSYHTCSLETGGKIFESVLLLSPIIPSLHHLTVVLLRENSYQTFACFGVKSDHDFLSNGKGNPPPPSSEWYITGLMAPPQEQKHVKVIFFASLGPP